MNQEILELDKQISAIFRSSENQQKYEKLISERENILNNQSSSETNNLRREIDEIKQRQLNAGEKRYQLLQTINDKADVVRQIQPELDKAQQELTKANFGLSFFERSISADRMRLNDLLQKLNRLTDVTDENIN